MSRSADRLFDEYLAASARAGDRRAFGRLAARWQPKLVAHAYRLIGEREAARDIAQEAWADIVKGLKRLDDVRVFPPGLSALFHAVRRMSFGATSGTESCRTNTRKKPRPMTIVRSKRS